MASLLAWGAAGAGQIGVNDEAVALGKSDVTVIKKLPSRMVSVAAGQYHSLAVDADGGLYSVGKADDSRLGRGGPPESWRRVPAFETQMAVAVAAGQDFSVALDSQGEVYSWGSAGRGQLGQGREAVEKGEQRVPRRIKSLSGIPIVAVSVGNRHALALSYGSDVYAWGENSDGQLGDGQYVARHTPYLLPEFRGKGTVAVAAGGRHSLALLASGYIYGFGCNRNGQLGVGNTSPKPRPTLLQWSRGKQASAIAAGDFHSLARTYTGHLYTWGGCQWGQLGLGIKDDAVPLPREVSDIQQHGRVVDIAAGRRHTLVLILDDTSAETKYKAFGFGANELHQLGLAEDHPAAKRAFVVAPVAIRPLETFRAFKVFAGGDHSFALGYRSDDSDGEQRLVRPPSVVPSPILARRSQQTTQDKDTVSPEEDVTKSPFGFRQLICHMDAESTGELLDRISKSEEEKGSEPSGGDTSITPLHKSVVRLVEQFFSSAACLNAAFIDHKRSYQSSGGSENPHLLLDLTSVRDLYDKLVKGGSQEILGALGNAIRQLAVKFGDLNLQAFEDYVFLIILFECPLLLSASMHSTSLEFLVAALLRLLASPAHSLDLLAVYRHAGAPFFVRLLHVLQSYLSHLASTPAAPREPVALVCTLLMRLHDVNVKAHLVPPEMFYNTDVGARPEHMASMQQWLLQPSMAFSYAHYPFLLTPDVKASLLTWLNSNVMALQMTRNLFTGQGPAILKLTVRREEIYQDTLDQLSTLPETALSCPLRVQFAGEEGVDEGGLVKEFFHLVMPKFFSRALVPMDNDGLRWFWFSAPTEKNLQAYHCLGLLYGLAFMNRVLIAPMFPKAFYKMLLLPEIKPGALDLEDLTSASPMLAKGLRDLLDYDGRNEENVFALTFEIDVRNPETGKTETLPMKPGGADMPVTAFNKEEYVSLYIHHYFYEQCCVSFDAFREGFSRVVHQSSALQLVRPDEWEVLLCGKFEWSLGDLRSVCKYHNYNPTDEIVNWFWETVEELTGQQKRKFLLFVTGTSRVPVRGAKDIVIVIQRMGDDPSRLPVAHTCYNVIDLPPYRSKVELRQKLVQAIEETQGFALA